jgi:iron complex outermembrane receptor protein
MTHIHLANQKTGDFMSSSFKGALLSASAMVALGLAAGPALAQTAPSNEAVTSSDGGAIQKQASAIGEVTVTARRRNETLVDVPLAIAVVTATKLEQLDIQNTTDLANYVPGLEFNNFGQADQRNDRGGSRILAFRGLNIAGAASLFLDGAAVTGNEIPASMDIGQVEVLRGPQSVYFGRSTMSGAVSYKTRPIPKDEWGGEFEAEVATQGTQNLQGTIAGPVIPNILGLRVTALEQKTDGYVTNNANNGATDLGAQDRNSISATADFTPTEKIEVKGYVNYFRDNDGPAATAFVPYTYDNCKFPGATYGTFCGQIPGKSASINYLNTTIPPVMAQAIFADPLLAGTGFKESVGAQRVALNSDIVATYQLPYGLKLLSITGYHTASQLATADGIGQPVLTANPATYPYEAYFYTLLNKNQDASEEIRLSSDPDKKFAWQVGGNVIQTKTQEQAIVDFQFNPTGGYGDYPQSINYTETDTYGIFGGLYYKPIDKLTASFEARYQWDNQKSTATNGTPPYATVTNSTNAATFTAFSPRVSIDYDIGGHRKIYASYAEGDLPGGFNTSINAFINNAPVLAQIQSIFGSTSNKYLEETLKIEELGIKGNFNEGKGFADINVYYGKLYNQQITNGALIPLLGYSVTATSNAGASTIYGLEAQSSYNITQDLSLNGTFAWNHTRRDIYLNNPGALEFGTTNFDGKEFQAVPEFTGSAILAYTHQLTAKLDGYTSLAVVYRGKEYTDAYNASYIPGRFQVDLRAGVTKDRLTFEAYIKNLLNDQNYTGGEVATDYGTGHSYAFFGGWAPPRQFGGRIRYSF